MATAADIWRKDKSVRTNESWVYSYMKRETNAAGDTRVVCTVGSCGWTLIRSPGDGTGNLAVHLQTKHDISPPPKSDEPAPASPSARADPTQRTLGMLCVTRALTSSNDHKLAILDFIIESRAAFNILELPTWKALVQTTWAPKTMKTFLRQSASQLRKDFAEHLARCPGVAVCIDEWMDFA